MPLAIPFETVFRKVPVAGIATAITGTANQEILSQGEYSVLFSKVCRQRG